MANRKTLARMSQLHINTGGLYTIADVDTITPPDALTPAIWTKISNLVSLDPQINKRNVDTEDFDNAGWASHLVSGRNMRVSGSYNKVVDTTATPDTFDAGQQALEDLAMLQGDEAIGQFRWTILDTDEVYVFNASVEIGGPGGGVNDMGRPTFTLDVDGIPYKGENPPLDDTP